MILDEETLVRLCKENGLKAFKATIGLDEETDIILDSDDITEFFDVCKSYDAKCVFYSCIKEEPESALLDKVNIMERIKTFVTSEDLHVKYGSWTYDDSDAIDVSALLDKYSDIVDSLVQKQSALLTVYPYDKPLFMDVFIPVQGCFIGVALMETPEKLDELAQNNSLIDDLFMEIEQEVAALYAADRERHHEALEMERMEINRRYEQAIEEIQALLKSDDKLMQCTNGRLRHAYARDLAYMFSDKFDCNITIGAVDSLVEMEYKRRKQLS